MGDELTCGVCGGRGYCKPEHRVDYDPVPCPQCGGSGKIEVTTDPLAIRLARVLSAGSIGGEAVPDVEVGRQKNGTAEAEIQDEYGDTITLVERGDKLQINAFMDPVLTRAQVAALLPLLVRFVETGRLAPDAEGNADG